MKNIKAKIFTSDDEGDFEERINSWLKGKSFSYLEVKYAGATKESVVVKCVFSCLILYTEE